MMASAAPPDPLAPAHHTFKIAWYEWSRMHKPPERLKAGIKLAGAYDDISIRKAILGLYRVPLQ
jgi:hypothetical protein